MTDPSARAVKPSLEEPVITLLVAFICPYPTGGLVITTWLPSFYGAGLGKSEKRLFAGISPERSKRTASDLQE